MIGPTGVGKTEISRRLAKLANAPFIKIEVTKFTEVGYVGRDVEQIIRDLVEASISLLKDSRRKNVRAQAELAAEDRILNALVGDNASEATRTKFRDKLRAGELDDKEIDLELTDTSSPFQGFEIPGQPGANMGMLDLSSMFGKGAGRTKSVKMKIGDAYAPLLSEEADKLIDDDSITREALERAENLSLIHI